MSAISAVSAQTSLFCCRCFNPSNKLYKQGKGIEPPVWRPKTRGTCVIISQTVSIAVHAVSLCTLLAVVCGIFSWRSIAPCNRNIDLKSNVSGNSLGHECAYRTEIATDAGGDLNVGLSLLRTTARKQRILSSISVYLEQKVTLHFAAKAPISRTSFRRATDCACRPASFMVIDTSVQSVGRSTQLKFPDSPSYIIRGKIVSGEGNSVKGAWPSTYISARIILIT